MVEKNICYVTVGRAESSAKAEECAGFFTPCPYSAFFAFHGNLVSGVFVLPESKRWWIEITDEQAPLLGLQKYKVFRVEDIDISSPWSRGEVSQDRELSPCGSNCKRCPQYLKPCTGCPATIYYKE